VTPKQATSSREAPASSEIVSLSERMGFMQALRLAFACAVLASALFASRLVGASLEDLTLVTAAYLAFSAAFEAVRRVGKGRGLAFVGGMLLIDGVYLAWIMYSTGGVQSPLRVLVYVHLIAVTLLASYRTGLKIALWHSLLYLVVFYAQAAEILDVKETIPGALPGTGSLFQRLAIFNIATLWLVAGGTAAFSALNERELRKRKGDLEVLAEMAAEFEDTEDPAVVAELLIAKLMEGFGFVRGAVLGGRDDSVGLLAYKGPGEPGRIEPGMDPIMEAAIEKRRPVLIKSVDTDANRRLAAALPLAGNVIVAPLIAEGQALGVVCVEHPGRSGRIERRIVSMVTQFAAHAALALRNAWLLEQVQRMADTDALTGIANRRTFELTLEKEVSRASRQGDQLTLVMVDVDHFKTFNDTYGHPAGDVALRQVAQVLADSCRVFDTAARYGGEEFALILPSCSSKESLAVADRLRESVSRIEAAAPITASAGVATFPVHAADPESLVKAADEALYESKRAGRDRVTRSRRRGITRPPASARRAQ
jgi:two-component system, cell cycle response regulator